MGIALLLALAAGAQPLATLHPAAALTVSDGAVRLGDLARLGGTVRARGLERRVVARLGRGRSVTLTNGQIAALVRRAVPGLAVRGGPESLVIRGGPAPAPASSPACFAASAPLAAGALLRPADLAATACRGREGGIAGLRFDPQSGSVRTAAALPAGAYLGRIALAAAPEVERGQRLTIVSTAGPVRIERPVVALQPGRSGRRAFVRDGEGQVFAAPVAAGPGDGR